MPANIFGNRWSYSYDGIGQLTSALGSEANGTARAQEQLTYGYDKAWNLVGRTNNGFAQAFTNDTRNQLTNVTRSGSFTVAGSTFGAASSVTVNGNAATLYSDRSYVKTGVTLADGDNTFTAVAQNVAGQTATDTASFYLPTTISLSYDSNGNLTNDGRRAFIYDDENQLVTNWVANAWKSEFVYDARTGISGALPRTQAGTDLLNIPITSYSSHPLSSRDCISSRESSNRRAICGSR